MDGSSALERPRHGLDIFKLDEALTYFNIETIIRNEIGEDTTTMSLDCGGVILAAKKIFHLRHIARDKLETTHRDSPLGIVQDKENMKLNQRTADLSPLFRLMSVLPDLDAAECKQVLDGDQLCWKVSLNDVIMVFLNWGGSLKALEMENCFPTLEKPRLTPPPLPRSKEKRQGGKTLFPSPATVRNVLTCLAERLPESSAMAVSDRTLLVRLLLYAGLDQSQRRNISRWTDAISTVLESFYPWDQETVAALVGGLALTGLDHKNIVYVCCCTFNLMSEKLLDAGLAACLHVLHLKFGLPAERSLTVLVNHLATTQDNLLTRYSLEDIYLITELVSSVLNRLSIHKSSCTQADVKGLYQWTVDTRNTLKQPPLMFDVTAGTVRERLSRLTCECNIVLRQLYNTSFNTTFSYFAIQSMDNSPVK
uniref:Uncharacterized protein n=1 Tax=Graphocephala atropunctata TaxID=36148 RepID=A0A1B6KJY9_9HEMI